MKKVQKRIQKHIGFSPSVIEVAEKKAERFGMTFPEYVRFLVLGDVRTEMEQVEVLEGEELESFIRGIEDYKAGRTTKFKNAKEAVKYLQSL